MRTNLLLLILVAASATGCNTLAGLTGIGTSLEFRGDAAAFYVATTGKAPDAAAIGASTMELEYFTTADKAVELLIDETDADGASRYRQFGSGSDSSAAERARGRDNDRFQAQTEAFVSILAGVLASQTGGLIGGSRAPPAAPGSPAPVPPPEGVEAPESDTAAVLSLILSRLEALESSSPAEIDAEALRAAAAGGSP